MRDLLESVKTLAVVGYTDKPGRAGHYVPKYLAEHGYRILGVNPRCEGCYPTLADLPEPADLVLLFRRPEEVTHHLPEILAMHPRPRAVWMQSGIRHDEVARALEREGIRVVQDRCMMVDHRTLLG